MILTKFLKNIADAIRYAEKSTNKIKAIDFADRIKKLGGNGFEVEIVEDSYEVKLETNFKTETIVINDTDETVVEDKLEESEE
ncbi:hypothetical protein [Eubacterium sp. LMAG:50]|jgi:hypothetical protein|uniref:Uncharacterized protein n=1 Tax=Myoviridae sp. ctNQr16 TaxID=2826644 RepID=A0A8S5MAU0_9CAUD|nr:hypothetical protein [Eubacterium sp. LMAG:50]DAD79342.1 MAG TPA: hypothetical protein [Myoviridae sp. ctNQr16]DAT53170.1 MAG TPA: hypothetical protein [Caudoviricetes sp.]DAY67056.1 MAG TPA: hypothetical protein [Caudoviricetes sp.]